jgi:hypothetical protein
MLTINDITPSSKDLDNSFYNYQISLTTKLDNLDTDFDQEIINEIVLWKVNRYAEMDSETLNLINQIKKDDTQLNPDLTDAILFNLLGKKQKGIRLAMASTILRFKNPRIYQIIDQRVYRFIYGQELKYSETDINQQIAIYLGYLTNLRNVCSKHNIAFETADRIFYLMDKYYNTGETLRGY